MDMLFQLIYAFIGVFLSLILTLLFVQNGRQIRMLGEKMDEGFRRMDETLAKMDTTLAKIAELIVIEERATRSLIEAHFK